MDINVIVGNNIKSLREEKSLSLDNLSVLTGVSKSMLGQIERGESSPSINVLWKIAKGFKVGLDALTTEKKEKVQKIKNMKPEVRDNGNFRLYPILTYEHTRNFEMYRVEIESQGKLEAKPHTKGAMEYITVYQGGLTIEVNGEYHYVDRGETLIFNADAPHQYINDSLIKTEFSLTVFYKK
jgi:transcriptional regulator with XRE-family HTH domain